MSWNINETNWYDLCEEEPLDEDAEIIDNNDEVNVRQVLDYTDPSDELLKEEKMSSLSKLKSKIKPKEQERIAKVGELVLFLKGKPVLIGNKKQIRVALEELMDTVDVDKLGDDDVIVFHRIDLETLF